MSLTLLLPLLGLVACGGGGGAPPALPAASSPGLGASGFAGCNRLNGRYESSGDGLRFDALATTRMHCEGAMELERRYLAALEATRRYRMGRSGLELLDDAGVVLAGFTAS